MTTRSSPRRASRSVTSTAFLATVSDTPSEMRRRGTWRRCQCPDRRRDEFCRRLAETELQRDAVGPHDQELGWCRGHHRQDNECACGRAIVAFGRMPSSTRKLVMDSVIATDIQVVHARACRQRHARGHRRLWGAVHSALVNLLTMNTSPDFNTSDGTQIRGLVEGLGSRIARSSFPMRRGMARAESPCSVADRDRNATLSLKTFARSPGWSGQGTATGLPLGRGPT